MNRLTFFSFYSGRWLIFCTISSISFLSIISYSWCYFYIILLSTAFVSYKIGLEACLLPLLNANGFKGYWILSWNFSSFKGIDFYYLRGYVGLGPNLVFSLEGSYWSSIKVSYSSTIYSSIWSCFLFLVGDLLTFLFSLLFSALIASLISSLKTLEFFNVSFKYFKPCRLSVSKHLAISWSIYT